MQLVFITMLYRARAAKDSFDVLQWRPKSFDAKVNFQAFYGTIFEIIFQVIKLDIVWKINSCNENVNHADSKVCLLESNYWPPVLLSVNIL